MRRLENEKSMVHPDKFVMIRSVTGGLPQSEHGALFSECVIVGTLSRSLKVE